MAERKDYVKVANELIKAFGLEDDKGKPAIKTGKKIKTEDIVSGIEEAIELIKKEDVLDTLPDALSEEAMNILKEMELFEVEDDEDDEEEEDEEETEVEDDEEDDEDDEDDEEEDEEDEEEEETEETDVENTDVEETEETTDNSDLIESVNSTKKLKDLKELAGNHGVFNSLNLDDYKGLQGSKKLKADMLDILSDGNSDVEETEEKPAKKESKKSEKKTTKGKKKSEKKADKKAETKTKKKETTKKPAKKTEKKAKKKATPKVKKYSRPEAVCDAIKKLGKKGFTFEEVLKKSDELFVEKGGKSNNPTATNVNRYIISGLVYFGVLEENNKKYKLV